MAKLISPKAELSAVYYVCNGKPEVSARLIAKLSENHFDHSPAKSAWKRLMSQAKSKGRVPDFYSLCEDPTLSNDDARHLKDFEPKRKIKSLEDVSDLVDTLETHRLLRAQYQLADSIYEHLDADEDVDPAVFTSKIELALADMRANRNAEDLIWSFGVDSNIGPLVEDVLDQDAKPHVVPTGFKTWDARNTGVPEGSLMVVAGTTGGGKSVVASVQLLLNMSMHVPTVLVPLEMSKREMVQRITANQSAIQVTKIVNKKLTEAEVLKAMKAMKALDKRIADQDSRYSIFEPDRDMTVEEILYSLKPFGYKVILIDYISLLKGVDGDDAWQALGSVARTCKLWANHNKCIVILLAQLSEEGILRYSRAVKEHASLMWQFVVTDANREAGEIEVRQPKARNLDPFPFALGVDYATMRVYDLDDAPDDIQHSGGSTDEKPRRNNSGKSKDDGEDKVERKSKTRVYDDDDDDEGAPLSTGKKKATILGDEDDD